MVLQMDDNKDNWEQFQHELKAELEQANKTLKEVALVLEQSQAEMIKLTQRSASVNAQLQQVQAQFDSIPRNDIRQAYTSSLETQQRLLVMRGQVEKLQSDKSHLEKMVELLENVQKVVTEYGEGGKAGKTAAETVEMVVNAQEAERLRLSRQMHDGPAQALSNFIVQTEIAARLFDMDPNRAKEELNNLKASAMSTFQKVRVFIFELRPMMLDDLGLVPTIRRYVDAFKEQTGMEVTLTIKGQERRLEPYIEVMVFRAAQELMGNSYRHNLDSGVKVQINIQIVIDETMVKVAVSDTGKGFDPQAITNKGGIGLKLIKERCEMIGGTLEIDAAPGHGSRIVLSIPCFSTEKTI
jgi:two-component system, NarL family, sensor histidine kinase DegS